VKRVAIIGCGAIGSTLAKAIDDGIVKAKLVGIFDIVEEKARKLCEVLKSNKPLIARNLDELLKLKPDIIVEAASQQAVKDYAVKILRNGINLMIMSVGALLDKSLFEEIIGVLSEGDVKIYIPSGAIAGLDAIRTLRIVGIERVVLRSRKPPRAIKNAPYLHEKNINIENVKEPTLIFKGKAREAVKAFPANVNVAATLALASNVEVDVEILADPTVDRNVHEIEVYSKASKLTVKVENVPTPGNPRTSYLATLSAIETLKEICEEGAIKVGT